MNNLQRQVTQFNHLFWFLEILLKQYDSPCIFLNVKRLKCFNLYRVPVFQSSAWESRLFESLNWGKVVQKQHFNSIEFFHNSNRFRYFFSAFSIFLMLLSLKFGNKTEFCYRWKRGVDRRSILLYTLEVL